MRASEFTTIRTEGGLLPAAVLQRVAALAPDLEGIGPGAYHLLDGERLSEAITRSWNRLVGAWAGFADALDALGDDDRTATTVSRSRWLLPLFDELGFGRLQGAKAVEIDGKAYAASHTWGAVPIHLVGARLTLDAKTTGVAGAARMSPHGLVQELLNRSDDHLWGFVANGLRLRVLRDNAALTRQAFVEFDLEAMFGGQVYADFAVLWLLCHQSRVEGDPPEKCILERWSLDAALRGTRALDQLRAGVESAVTELGTGFVRHRDNGELRRRLDAGELSTEDFQRQLLRLVYRLLFLLVAEARDLLLDPTAEATAKERYRRWYSVERLRALAELRRGGPHADLWEQLLVVFGGLGRPVGEPRLALPNLGSFLWSAPATADLDRARLANSFLLAAVRALTTTQDPRQKVRQSVDYRNLGSEELGSVYESLLELHAEVDVTVRTFALATAGGNERKTTGSYYTPTSLINELLDSALDPVLDEAARAEDAEAAILGLTVLDPACGSGHFLIAAAHRIAHRLAAVRTGEPQPGPEPIRAALRDVVGRCLHGIDVNEMAVELCKVSLWMAAVEPGKPLSFLDHRIVCGNSLLGTTPRLLAAGIPDGAFKALTGDDKDVAKSLKQANKAERAGQGTLDFANPAAATHAAVAEGFAAVDAEDGDTWAGIQAKERRWSGVIHGDAYARTQLAADAWCAAFVAPKVPGAPRITTAFVRRAERQTADRLDPATVDAVAARQRQYRFLHLHLAFPHVFSVPDEFDGGGEGTGWDGGFDVVLGNPPWETTELKEQEFFASRAPEIAAAAGARRKRLILALAGDEPDLLAEYQAEARTIDGVRHVLSNSDRFPLCGRGRVNTFSVFAELMRDSISPVGRAGVIVPTGIATDDTTKHFFADLVDKRSLVSLFDFENAAPMFVGVHRSFKFCLLTLTGLDRPIEEAQFTFFAHTTADLADPDRTFTLTPADFRLLNPSSRTCPIFRTRRDAEITKRVYRHLPVLHGSSFPDRGWDIRLRQGMFNMTSDSDLFSSEAELTQAGLALSGNRFRIDRTEWLPLYEAKMFHSFDHRWASVADIAEVDRVDPADLPRPRYWVFAEDVVSTGAVSKGYLLAYRNITNVTNETTLVMSALPAVAAGHSALLVESECMPILLGLAGSKILDAIVRRKLGGTNLTFGYFLQLPAPSPSSFRACCSWHQTVSTQEWIAPRVLELTYTAWDLEGFANDVGYFGPPFRWDDERRALLRAELDGAFFHLYGIDDRDDVDYILSTFPIVNRKDVARFGEERTRRLVLERYDALAAAIATGVPCETVLDPPPADPAVAHPESTRPDWAVPPTRP